MGAFLVYFESNALRVSFVKVVVAVVDTGSDVELHVVHKAGPAFQTLTTPLTRMLSPLKSLSVPVALLKSFGLFPATPEKHQVVGQDPDPEADFALLAYKL